MYVDLLFQLFKRMNWKNIWKKIQTMFQKTSRLSWLYQSRRSWAEVKENRISPLRKLNLFLLPVIGKHSMINKCFRGEGGPWNVSEPSNFSNCYFGRNGYGLFTAEVISSLKGSFAEVAIRWRQTPDAIKDKYNMEAVRVRVSPIWFAVEIPVSTTLLLVRSLMTHLVD